jgi:hypothetical protein
VVAVPGSRSLHRHHLRPRRTGPPGTGPIPAPRSRSRPWWGGRREAVRGGGGRVRSAVWFGPGRFGSGTGVTVPAGTVAAAGVTGIELRPAVVCGFARGEVGGREDVGGLQLSVRGRVARARPGSSACS